MPRTKKSLLKQNLQQIPVLIQDSGVESTYFNVKQLSGVFTGGKNAFLISGTSLLKPGTEILIELIDSSGNSVYVEAIRGFVEANSRLVVVEIHPSTSAGSSILTIVGTAAKTNTGQILTPNQTDKPNVRWQKKILIEPRNRNITPLRLKKVPELYSTEEILKPVEFLQNKSTDDTGKYILRPIYNSAKQMGYSIKPTDYNYRFISSSFRFNTELTGSLFIETRQYTSSIPFTTSSYTVINSDTASVKLPINVINLMRGLTDTNITSSITKNIINPPLLLSGAYQVTSSQYSSSDGTKFYQIIDVITGSIVETYDEITSIYVASGIDKSFINFKLINLDTVSGELSRVKTSFRRAESTDDFVFLADTQLKVTELLTTSSDNTYQRQKSIGIFDYVEGVPSLYANWYSSRITASSIPDISYYTSSLSSSNNYLMYLASDMLMNSAMSSASYNEYTNQNYFFGTRSLFPVFSTSEYTLKFDSVVTSSYASTSDFSLDVYLIGSAIVDKNPLGKKIGNITTKAKDIAVFTNTTFNFTVPRNGEIGIRFIPKNGIWRFANISLKVAEEYAFSPDEVTFLLENKLIQSASVVFRAELFDINNNAIDLNIISPATYFTGSSQ